MKKHKVTKTYQEINEKIRSGSVVVVTAEEMIDIVKEKGACDAAKAVDVVTTRTFAPICVLLWCIYQLWSLKTRTEGI